VRKKLATLETKKNSLNLSKEGVQSQPSKFKRFKSHGSKREQTHKMSEKEG